MIEARAVVLPRFEAAEALQHTTMILDHEAVVLDEPGPTGFGLLQQALGASAAGTLLVRRYSSCLICSTTTAAISARFRCGSRASSWKARWRVRQVKSCSQWTLAAPSCCASLVSTGLKAL